MFDYNYALAESFRQYRQIEKKLRHMQQIPPREFGEAIQKRRKKKKVRG